MFEDKFFTIADIAKMTKMTDRTIRNYIAKGTLRGTKVGGQWRFTRADVSSFFSNEKVEDDLKFKTKQQIVDFYLDDDEKINDGCIGCSIFRFKCDDHEKRKAIFIKISQVIDKSKVIKKIIFVNDDGLVKIVMIADISQLFVVSKILKEMCV